jgi:hypothetical protein
MPAPAGEYVTRVELEPWMRSVEQKLDQLRKIFGLNGHPAEEVGAHWQQLQLLVAETPLLIQMARDNQQVREELRARGLQVDPKGFAEHYAHMDTLVSAADDLAEMATDHMKVKRLREARLLIEQADEERQTLLEAELSKSPTYRLRRRLRGFAGNTSSKLWWGVIAAIAWVTVSTIGPFLAGLLGTVLHHGVHPIH